MSSRSRPVSHFTHPHAAVTAVSFEDETYPVVSGVVHCPVDIGQGADWRPATADEITAYEAGLDEHAAQASDGPSDDDDKKPRRKR